MKYYAGIGSRETPFDIQLMMFDIAVKLSSKYTLRSGGAIGADKSFESGCDSVAGNKEIFLSKDCTKEAMSYSSNFHPTWHNCNYGVRTLHGRNAMIILGRDLNSPVERVICWCKESNGEWQGGTGQGLRIAKANNIKIYNLYLEEIRNKFYEFLYWKKI